MPDDIVARLRESDGGYFVRKMFTEAADEIERLRARISELEAKIVAIAAERDNIEDMLAGRKPIL